MNPSAAREESSRRMLRHRKRPYLLAPLGALCILLPSIGSAEHGINGDWAFEVPDTWHAAGDWTFYVQSEELDAAHSAVTSCLIDFNTCSVATPSARVFAGDNGAVQCAPSGCERFLKALKSTLEKMRALNIAKAQLDLHELLAGVENGEFVGAGEGELPPAPAFAETGAIEEDVEWALTIDEVQQEISQAAIEAIAAGLGCMVLGVIFGGGGLAACLIVALVIFLASAIVRLTWLLIGEFTVEWYGYRWAGDGAVSGLVTGSVDGVHGADQGVFHFISFGGNSEDEYESEKAKARNTAVSLANTFMPIRGPGTATVSVPPLGLDIDFPGTGAVDMRSDVNPTLLFEGSVAPLSDTDLRIRAVLEAEGGNQECGESGFGPSCDDALCLYPNLGQPLVHCPVDLSWPGELPHAAKQSLEAAGVDPALMGPLMTCAATAVCEPASIAVSLLAMATQAGVPISDGDLAKLRQMASP